MSSPEGGARTLTKRSIRLRSWGMVLAIPLLLMLQAFTPAPAIMLSLFIALGLLITSLVWATAIYRGLSVERRRARDWAQVGDILEEKFRLTNRSWLPIPWAEVEDLSDMPGYQAGYAAGLPGSQARAWSTRGLCIQRGVYTLGPTRVIWGDPFGLLEISIEQEDAQPFFVYPPIVGLTTLSRSRILAHGSARSTMRSFETEDSVSGTRPYMPGDPFKRIHWRTTAHRSLPETEDIWVKELDPQPQADYWLILDGDAQVQAGAGLASTEEYAVTLAASLAYQMLHDHRAVGLIVQGAESTLLTPRRGQQQLLQILRVLAGVRAEGEVPYAQVLASAEPLIERGSSVALITPSCDPAWTIALSRLMRQPLQVTAWVLDGASFGGDADLDTVTEALAHLGVPSQVIGAELGLLDGISPAAARVAASPAAQSAPAPSDAAQARPTAIV